MLKYKKRKCQRILVLICSFIVFALSGCGGSGTSGSQNKEDGNNHPNPVTPIAVSGSATEQEQKDAKETGKGFTIKSSHANSTNLYQGEDTEEEYSNVIVQCRLDGTKIRNLEVERKGADIISVRYVDDEWIYYTRWKKKNPADAELWRAPIQKKNDCDDILFENEEFLFLSDDGIFDDIYVLGNYIYYNESGGGAKASTYCKYDMNKKEWVAFDKGSPEQNAASGARWIGAVGDNMILFCDEELATEGNAGIYVQPVSSSKFQKIQELGGDDNVYYSVSHYACSQEAFFFVCDTFWDINEDKKMAVMVWRPGMERALTYMCDKDAKKTLEKSKSYAAKKMTLEEFKYCDWSVWLDESHLYILLEGLGAAEGELEDAEDVWFACDGIDKYNLKILEKAPEFFWDDNE